MSLLALVDLAVPLAPGLEGSEHTTLAAHVTEGGLPGAVRTATGDTGDTGHGATGTPRLGGGLVTGLGGDRVRLAVVLRHVGVHHRDDVRTDGGREDGGERSLGGLQKLGWVRTSRRGEHERGECGNTANGQPLSFFGECLCVKNNIKKNEV